MVTNPDSSRSIAAKRTSAEHTSDAAMRTIVKKVTRGAANLGDALRNAYTPCPGPFPKGDAFFSRSL